MIERAGQGCAIGSALFERIHQPYVREGQRTGALRFGDQRAMALAGALCLVVHAVTGFTNKSLRGQVAGLLGTDYSASQMSYDLRRLRLHGLIERIPHTNTYVATPEGIRVAVFYTKLHRRLLDPLLDADRPPAPARTTDSSADYRFSHTRLRAATLASELPHEKTCHIVKRLNSKEELVGRPFRTFRCSPTNLNF